MYWRTSCIKVHRTYGKSIEYQQVLSVNVINFVYRLLNKYLDFVPTGDVHNKTKINNDGRNYFRITKLKGHFKENQKANDLNKLKIMKKEKQTWIPKKDHHSIEIFIDPMEISSFRYRVKGYRTIGYQYFFFSENRKKKQKHSRQWRFILLSILSNTQEKLWSVCFI